ncbi:hypothetical protein KA082_01715 [Candidatus Woesebacteria bacterium]|nr:hypothetical protein [Candidatus Woesebacteria bacterium]
MAKIKEAFGKIALRANQMAEIAWFVSNLFLCSPAVLKAQDTTATPQKNTQTELSQPDAPREAKKKEQIQVTDMTGFFAQSEEIYAAVLKQAETDPNVAANLVALREIAIAPSSATQDEALSTQQQSTGSSGSAAKPDSNRSVFLPLISRSESSKPAEPSEAQKKEVATLLNSIQINLGKMGWEVQVTTETVDGERVDGTLSVLRSFDWFFAKILEAQNSAGLPSEVAAIRKFDIIGLPKLVINFAPDKCLYTADRIEKGQVTFEVSKFDECVLYGVLGLMNLDSRGDSHLITKRASNGILMLSLWSAFGQFIKSLTTEEAAQYVGYDDSRLMREMLTAQDLGKRILYKSNDPTCEIVGYATFSPASIAAINDLYAIDITDKLDPIFKRSLEEKLERDLLQGYPNTSSKLYELDGVIAAWASEVLQGNYQLPSWSNTAFIGMYNLFKDEQIIDPTLSDAALQKKKETQKISYAVAFKTRDSSDGPEYWQIIWFAAAFKDGKQRILVRPLEAMYFPWNSSLHQIFNDQDVVGESSTRSTKVYKFTDQYGNTATVAKLEEQGFKVHDYRGDSLDGADGESGIECNHLVQGTPITPELTH